MEKTVKQCSIGLKYKLEGKTKTWISYLANKREDNWWMVELCQFTSDGKTFDLEISFEGFEYEMRVVEEGIEFQPLEKAAKHQVLEAEIEKEADMKPPISDSDNTYWEQKLPNDYEDIIKWSKYNLQWTTKKELYSIFCKGFLINDEEWFFLDKNGKRCHMLSAREVFEIDKNYPASWWSSPESRFGETLVFGSSNEYKVILQRKINGHVLSPQTTYACYLVYKLPKYQYKCEAPVKVSYFQDSSDYWYI